MTLVAPQPALADRSTSRIGYLGPVDRFDALLSAGRAIAAATTVAAVRQAVEDALATVLPIDQAFLFEVRGLDIAPIDGDREWVLDDGTRALIHQAMAADGVVTSGSALCAPISRTGRMTGGFLVTRREASGVFDHEDRRLAEFIAALAGATLDHVARSEAHFRALVRNSHDLTIVTDASGRTLYVSPSMTRLLGYPTTVVGQLDGHLVHPDDQERVLNAYRLARFSPATRPTIELRAQHRDGSWRWLEMTVTNLLADELIQGLVFNIRDITDRKSAEVALEQASEQFRLSFENAPIGMALTSIDPATEGRMLRVNQAMADMLGYTRDDLLCRTVAEITHPDDRRADQAAVASFLSGQATSFATEKRFLHADGHSIWVQLQVNMVMGHDGPHRYVINQMLDVTERREAEERLTFLALHDPLTGLANRRLLLDRLSLALARAARTGRMVAVLYLDLDRFKGINDSLGHDRGDQSAAPGRVAAGPDGPRDRHPGSPRRRRVRPGGRRPREPGRGDRHRPAHRAVLRPALRPVGAEGLHQRQRGDHHGQRRHRRQHRLAPCRCRHVPGQGTGPGLPSPVRRRRP